MKIEKVIVKNFKSLRNTVVIFNNQTNIIVGDNETGKSSLLEAINLALTGQLNGRSLVYDLHPFLFNVDAVKEYITNLQEGKNTEPPKILIEVYLTKDQDIPDLEGKANSLREAAQGISFVLEYDNSYEKEFTRAC